MRGRLPEDRDTDPFPDEDELTVEGDEPHEAIVIELKDGMPAWRKIEKYRELRELRHRIQDDVYGTPPVDDLWELDAN